LLHKAECDMKKLFLIAVVIVGGLVVSCEKQDFKPRDCHKDNVPTWEDRKANVPGTGNGTVSEGGGITDPNNDEDGNGRKKI